MVESHESRSHWTLMKKSEVNNNHRNKYGKLVTFLSIWYFKSKILPDGRLIKHKARICAHGGMQQLGVNYLGAYAIVVNWISVISLIDLEIIHELTNRSISFVHSFPQS